MGLILDSSVLIAGERAGESVRQILERIRASQGEIESGLSAVTVVELTHGIYRAKSDTHRDRRRAFAEELLPKNFAVPSQYTQLRSKLPDWPGG